MLNDTYSTVRRATVGRNVLSVLGSVFLLASFLFWGVLHYTVFVSPAGFAIPQVIVAVVMTVVYSLALPLLLSMLIPTTPAGQMLQRTQWRTIGFPVVIGSALFLAWHARNLMLLWFSAQPLIAEAEQQSAYTLGALIAFVIIPALAWVQVTPERWLQEIQTAHLVRKLEIEQRGELAIIRARMVWAESKAAVSYARLLPAEQAEVRDTLKGLLMGISDNQRAIARTMGIQGEVERSILGDAEIADSLSYVAEQLERPAQVIDRNLTYFDGPDRELDPKGSNSAAPAHVDTRLQSSEPRGAPDAARRRTSSGDDAYARAARAAFGVTPWTIKKLAARLQVGDTSARQLRDDWQTAGWIRETTLGRWVFVTERGG
jgi:hypothetical protein